MARVGRPSSGKGLDVRQLPPLRVLPRRSDRLLPIGDVGAETLVAWQSSQLDRHAPLTVLNSRKVGRQAFGEAVKLGLIASNPFDLVKPPPAKRVNPGRALSAVDAKALMRAAQPLRLGAAVTLLFCQGWRVSEVLGLAWEDIDFREPARIQRETAYAVTGNRPRSGPRRQAPRACTFWHRRRSSISDDAGSSSPRNG
ncbi:MAG: hypothetical protein R2705_08950 [Ilumatobacteraceae bacterium]